MPWLPLRRCCLMVLLGACATAGCRRDGPQRYPVAGKVSWENAPLPVGDIVLTPTDGGVPDAGKIKDGAYELMATEGPKQVAIIAVREAGPVDPSMGMARKENYIPARYNDKTTLTATVTPDGPNEFDFSLSEKEPPN